MLDIEVLNKEVVEERLSSLTPHVRQRLRSVIGTKMIDLREGVKGKVSTLFNRGTSSRPGSGRLLASIGGEMSESVTDVSATVFSRGVPYARIHEYGGQTRAHTILPRNASVLAFMGRDGKMVFARKVNHPGSNIPERSFMRSTLAEQRLEIIGAIRSAVAGEVEK